MENIIKWLEEWYSSQCNGDWEHENVIKIEAVSNPGWYITIDLNYTSMEFMNVDVGVVEKGENDWYFYRIVDHQFHASGDPGKLTFLLEKFKELADSV